MADHPTAAETPGAPSLLRSGAFSLVTSVAPLVVALIALPLLTRRLGAERFGLLALAWAWLSYAALLDFGLGRSLTRIVAAADSGDAPEAPITAFVATALALLAGVGAAVGLAGAAIAPWYVISILHVSPELRLDAIVSAVIFALTVPLITAASVPRAVLEARLQFRDVNLVRLPVSVASFGVPLLLLPFTASLTVIAVTIASVRVWAFWRYQRLAATSLRRDPQHPGARAHLRPLLRLGAWTTVSNVLSPLMTVADRFVIASMISVSAVAMYAVPWEAVTRLFIVPGALTMVLFPAIARAATAREDHLVPLHRAGTRLLTLIVAPICAIACLLAPWLLELAGGAQYRGDSVTVLRILSIGVAANCIAAVPFTLLQASGRARWAATLHLIEIVPFGFLLWFAIHRWGIVGAASAWTMRTLVDAALLAWRAQRVAPLPVSALLMNLAGVGVVAAAAWGSAFVPGASRSALMLAAVLLCAIPLVLWHQRTPAERMVFEHIDGRA